LRTRRKDRSLRRRHGFRLAGREREIRKWWAGEEQQIHGSATIKPKKRKRGPATHGFRGPYAEPRGGGKKAYTASTAGARKGPPGKTKAPVQVSVLVRRLMPAI